MRFLILAALAAAGPSSAAPPAEPHSTAPPPAAALPRSSGVLCERPDIHWADNVGRPESRPLTELPPGDTILAVYREREDGCIDPVIVRYGDGRSAPAATTLQPVRPKARLWR